MTLSLNILYLTGHPWLRYNTKSKINYDIIGISKKTYHLVLYAGRLFLQGTFFVYRVYHLISIYHTHNNYSLNTKCTAERWPLTYLLNFNLPIEIEHIRIFTNNIVYDFYNFAVVVSNITRRSTLFFANQLRMDVGWRFLFTHSSCVRLYVRRYSSSMVLDFGLVNAVGRHFFVHFTTNFQRSHVRVSKKCNLYLNIKHIFLFYNTYILMW